jgi:hypothetical protein
MMMQIGFQPTAPPTACAETLPPRFFSIARRYYDAPRKYPSRIHFVFIFRHQLLPNVA